MLVCCQEGCLQRLPHLGLFATATAFFRAFEYFCSRQGNIRQVLRRQDEGVCVWDARLQCRCVQADRPQRSDGAALFFALRQKALYRFTYLAKLFSERLSDIGTHEEINLVELWNIYSTDRACSVDTAEDGLFQFASSLGLRLESCRNCATCPKKKETRICPLSWRTTALSSSTRAKILRLARPRAQWNHAHNVQQTGWTKDHIFDPAQKPFLGVIRHYITRGHRIRFMNSSADFFVSSTRFSDVSYKQIGWTGFCTTCSSTVLFTSSVLDCLASWLASRSWWEWPF